MNRHLLAMVCALVLAGCSNTGQPSAQASVPAASPAIKPVAPSAATPEPATMARYDGYGDMRFGMDEVTFDKAWGGELKGAPEQDSTCFYKTPKWVARSADFDFMFEQGRFVRYDVGTAKEAAPGGGKVGMTAAQIHSMYGVHVEEQPHKYVAGAKYLRVKAPQGNAVLVFETDEHAKVTRWHAGVPPQVDYVEGCG
jgi:hypothetical protein